MANLNFVEQGKGEPVVLMHGLFGSLSNLGLFARSLLENYRVISIDMPNHGESPHQKQMSYPSMAEEVVALLDELGISRVSLVGHSMGGKVAMQIALLYPHRVKKVIVADIAPVTYDSHHSDILEGLEKLVSSQVTSRAEADQLLSSYEPEAGVRGFLLKNLKKLPDGTFGLKLNLPSILENYNTTLTAAPQGGPFDGEVLFLKGENSAYIQAKHRDHILQLFPNAQIKVIAGTGHWLHSEKPETFNKLARRFLDKDTE